MSKFWLVCFMFMGLSSWAQVANDRPETAEVVCPIEKLTGTTVGATPDTDYCGESHASVYFKFHTLLEGGNVYANVQVLECEEGFGFDKDLRVVILDPEMNYQPVSNCEKGDDSFFTTGLNLFPDKEYVVMVDADEEGPQITNPSRCSFELQITGPGVGISVGPDKTINLGESVEINAYGADNYQWSPENSLSNPNISNPNAFPTYSTKYAVRSLNKHGCEVFNWVNVYVNVPVVTVNTITPNGDGVNDVWNINGLNELFPLADVQIYSRWGKAVFSSVGYPIPWDGTSRGTAVPMGTYYYVIDLKNRNGNPVILKGEISVIR